MRTYYNIYLSFGQVLEQGCGLLSRTCPGQIVYTDGHILQTARERAIVLVGQNSGRHEHRHLFAVAGRFESGPNGHFRLAKAHIATDQTVHRTCTFHIGLHILCCLQLIRRILIEETGLQFVLKIRVVTKGKALFTATLGIEFYQVAGDILDMFLGALLQFLPLACAQMRQTGRLTIVLRLVFRDFVERVDGHVDTVAILIEDLYHLLIPPTFSPLSEGGV